MTTTATKEAQPMDLQLDIPSQPRRIVTRIEGSSPGCTLKRPQERDEHVLRAAAEELAKRCVIWDPTSTVDDWIDPLVKAASDWDDGYRLARNLDRNAHVEADANLVEVLDDADFILGRAHERELKRWVGIVGFDPAFAVGDTVDCRHGRGVVNSVLVETAQYVISTDGRTKGGYLLAADNVKAPDPDA